MSGGIWRQQTEPKVTFFFGNCEGGGARGLSGRISCPAGVLPGVLRECINDDEGGGVRHLIKVEYYVPGRPNRLPVVEPAYVGLRYAGN